MASLNKFPNMKGFNDSIKALFGAVLIVVLLVVVCVLSGVEGPLFGQNQLTPTGLDYFIKGEAIVAGWLFLIAASEEIHDLFALLTKAIRTGLAESDLHGPDPRDVLPGPLRRIVTNLWIPVTLQFCLVGWLIYASGGLINSPYTPVLIAMMIIGQSVYPAPPIDPGPNPKLRDILAFLWRVACFYGYPQLMFGSLLVALALLQEYHPVVTKTAPIAETIFTTQLSLFVSMCIVFVTRRLDRTAAPGTG